MMLFYRNGSAPVKDGMRSNARAPHPGPLPAGAGRGGASSTGSARGAEAYFGSGTNFGRRGEARYAAMRGRLATRSAKAASAG